MLEFIPALLIWLYLQAVMITATVMIYKRENYELGALTFWYRAFTYPALLIIKVLRPWKR